MTEFLTDHDRAGYRFLRGSKPFSFGVIARPGHEIIHCQLRTEMPWQAGLDYARAVVEARGLTRHNICAVELRCPQPHTLGAFDSFNDLYAQRLADWDMLVDARNPIARTNVAPVIDPPTETLLFGFSFVTSGTTDGTFIVSGAGELPHRGLDRNLIVRVGETSGDAIREKIECVIRITKTRLKRLGADPRQLPTRTNVYCCHDIGPHIEVLARDLPGARTVGLNWFYARPPVAELEFEIDMHGAARHEVV